MAKPNLNRVEMPRQEPEVRAHNFKEVATGYSAEQAKEEANRCMQCKNRNCTVGCPVGVDIPEFKKSNILGNPDIQKKMVGRMLKITSKIADSKKCDVNGVPYQINKFYINGLAEDV